jgi:hypothetical protein
MVIYQKNNYKHLPISCPLNTYLFIIGYLMTYLLPTYLPTNLSPTYLATYILPSLP